jgi:signal transduction histidine kinase
MIHPEDIGKINYASAEASFFDKPLVIRLICKDGKVKWCEQSNVPIFTGEGELLAIEGIARDITDQKHFEEKLKELNVQLLQKQSDLENLNVSLEKRIALEVEKSRGLDQIMALQARQAAIGEMMANVAHQWRQPLNVLSLAVYDLADAFEYDELDKSYMENAVGEMNRIIQEMSKTIDDFRSFYKPEKEKKGFRIASVIKNALFFMKPYFDKSNIIVRKDVLPEIMVFGYASQLEQVLINILKNALDALEEFDKGKRQVFIKTYFVNESYCTIEIFNSGEPVAEEFVPRLFDPYFTTKPEGQGLGLGLYVAKTIVEMNMKGKINCENSPLGVKFAIELPCSETNN